MINIFIANLDWSITSEDLRTTFSTFGDVHYAHVVFEKDTKRSRGYGYVEMESAEAAIAAITALNGMEINGRAIDVKVASPKSNRPKKVEKKPAEKKFQKKPFSKPYNKFSNNSGGYSRSNDHRPSSSNREAGSEERTTNRVMRPRRKNTEGGDENRYEKVERMTRRIDDNN